MSPWRRGHRRRLCGLAGDVSGSKRHVYAGRAEGKLAEGGRAHQGTGGKEVTKTAQDITVLVTLLVVHVVGRLGGNVFAHRLERGRERDGLSAELVYLEWKRCVARHKCSVFVSYDAGRTPLQRYCRYVAENKSWLLDSAGLLFRESFDTLTLGIFSPPLMQCPQPLMFDVVP